MAVASRSLRSSGFSLKSVFFAGLGIILIIGLFFIPEIIQFKRSASEVSSVVNSMKTLQTAAVSIPKDPKDSQLSRIASLIDSGYLDKISNNKTAPDATKLEDKAKADNKGQAEQLSKAAVVKSDLKAESGPSWKSLRSKNSKTELKKSHKELLKILSTLSYDKKGSRFAVLNLANGMEQLVDGNMDKNVSAAAALTQLENLHSACIKEFLREGVDHIVYKRFVSLDFGPAISTWSAKLSGRLVPFNPQLTLTHLSVNKRKNMGSGSPVKISFQGFVVGDDVERIEVVAGGVRLNDLVPKSVDKNGYRKFKSARFELNGKVLLKVSDKKGRIYQKLYSFYPRAKIFENQKGRYIIPKPASEFDSRLDRFFTYQIAKPSEASDSFLESQGFERF